MGSGILGAENEGLRPENTYSRVVWSEPHKTQAQKGVIL